MPKPPKPIKHKGKAASCKPNVSASGTCESNKSDNDPLENFEVELIWCVQQLESSLASKKMTARLAEDASKSLKTLKSNKAPLIRKRQVMRATFGDYRAKMDEEAKKSLKVNSNLNFSKVPTNEKATFLKKSTVVSKRAEVEESSAERTIDRRTDEDAGGRCDKRFAFLPSDNSFRFDFHATRASDDSVGKSVADE